MACLAGPDHGERAPGGRALQGLAWPGGAHGAEPESPVWNAPARGVTAGCDPLRRPPSRSAVWGAACAPGAAGDARPEASVPGSDEGEKGLELARRPLPA